MRTRTLSIIAAAVLVVVSGVGAGVVAQMGPGHMMDDGDFWQPGWMHRHMWGRRNAPPEMRARMQRHWTFMHEGVPKEYRHAQSPLKPTTDDISAGGALYVQNCATCHGKSGMGDGEAGKSLTPSPALLAWMIQRPVAVDEYLMWTISEGGADFKTSMPAFKGTLTRDQIWQIIAYMRAGFPAIETKAVPKK
jgi:mono/diheme cytochrome c family protein